MKLDREDRNPSVIRKLGIEALSEALGPVGMARFFQQYETGVGDYTKDRALWMKGEDIKSIAEGIRKNRKRRKL